MLQIQKLSFGDQIDNFNKTKEGMKQKIGSEAAEKLCSEAIFFIGIGIDIIIQPSVLFLLLLPYHSNRQQILRFVFREQ